MLPVKLYVVHAADRGRKEVVAEMVGQQQEDRQMLPKIDFPQKNGTMLSYRSLLCTSMLCQPGIWEHGRRVV